MVAATVGRACAEDCLVWRNVGCPLLSRVICVFVAWCFSCGAIFAQGASPDFADPMSSREFATLMRSHANVTPEQWATLHLLHEDSLRESAALRGGEIEAFFADEIRMSAGIWRPEVEKGLLPRRRRIASQIASIEGRLFENVVTVVGEESQPAIERARMERECQRRESEIQRNGLSPGGEGDLTPFVLALEWEADKRPEVLASLTEYQRRLVSLLRSMADAAPDAAPFPSRAAPGGSSDASRRQAEVVRLKTEVRSTHWRLVESLERIAPRGGATLRERWLRERYGAIGSSPRPAYPLKAALRVRGIDEESRLRLASALKEIDEADRSLIKKAVQIIDENDAAIPGALRPGEVDERLASLEAEYRRLGERASALVTELLGRDRARVAIRRAWNRDFGDTSWTIDVAEPDAATPPRSERAGQSLGLEAIAKGLTRAQCDAILKRCGRDASESASLAAAFERYQSALEANVAPAAKEMMGALGRPSSADKPRNALVYAVRAALEAAEAPLFASLAAQVPPEKAPIVAAARTRRLFEVWTSRSMLTSQVVAQVEMPSDPIVTIERATRDEALRERLTTIAFAEAPALLVSVRALEATLAEPVEDRLAAAKRQWAAREACIGAFANLRTKLLQLIDVAHRPRFEAALLCAAYPSLEHYRSAGQAVDAALALEGLSAESRAAIEKLDAEFAVAYLDCCKRMTPARQPEPESPNQIGQWMMIDGLQGRRVGRARFEREELSAHTITKLRSLLTPEQQAAVPAIDRLDVYVAAGTAGSS